MALGMKVVRPLREAARALANATAIACGTIGERLLALRHLGRSNRNVRMDRLKKLRAAEQSVREETFAAFADEVDVLEHALDLTHRVIGSVRQLTLDDTFLRALLVSRALGSLRCAWLSAAAGYRTQALTLARAAFEDYATAAWVRAYPDDSELWLWEIVDTAPEPDRYPPRFKDIFDKLEENEPELAGVHESIYGHLSESAHPRAPGLRWNVRWGAQGTEGAKHAAELQPIFDEAATASCLHFLLLIAGLILGVATELHAATAPDSEDDGDDLVAESTLVGEKIRDANARLRSMVPTGTD